LRESQICFFLIAILLVVQYGQEILG
jgi:hypothetical protein